MTLPEFVLFLLSILTSAAGQFFLKSGALKLGQIETSNALDHVLGFIKTPEIIAGLASYGLGAVAYILLLKTARLSVGGSAIAVNYVVSFLIGRFLFGDPIPMTRYVGFSLITCGIIFVIWKK